MTNSCLQVAEIMLNCAQHVEFESIIKSPEKSPPKGQRQMSQIVRAGSSLKRIDQLLEVFEQRVLSPMELATIVCVPLPKKELLQQRAK